VKVVPSTANLFSVIGPRMTLGREDEINHVGDPGDLGPLRVGKPFRPVAFGQIFRRDLFQPLPHFPC
jgi:hypothetical protein